MLIVKPWQRTFVSVGHENSRHELVLTVLPHLVPIGGVSVGVSGEESVPSILYAW